MEPEMLFADIGRELSRIGCAEIFLLEITPILKAFFLYETAKVPFGAERALKTLQGLSPGVSAASVWAALLKADP
jgi:hypothetical protein